MKQDDPVYRKAVSRLEELCALEAERKELEAFLRTYERLTSAALPVSSVSALQAHESPVVPTTNGKPASTKSIVDEVMKILSERKSPMALGEIFDALSRRGVVIGGKIPKYNLGAKLSADQSLRTGPEGWWFSSDPYPSRLDGYEYEEGPVTEVTRPLYSNGAADLTSA